MTLTQQNVPESPAVSGTGLPLGHYPALIAELLEKNPVDGLHLARAYANAAEHSGMLGDCASSDLCLSQALSVAGRMAEARASAEAAAEKFGRLGNVLAQAAAEADAGQYSLALSEYEEAEVLLVSAIQRAQRLAVPEAQATQAKALNNLAGVQHSQGHTPAALQSLHAARELWTGLGDVRGQANCLSNIGNIQTWLGEYHGAITALTEAYELHHRHLRDARSEAFILSSLARLHSLNNQLQLAIDVNASAIRTAAELPESTIQATLHLNQGTYYLDAGDLERAGAHLHEALSRSRRLGYRAAEMNVLDSLGLLYTRQHHAEAAEDAFVAALALCAEVGDARVEMGASLNLGRLYVIMKPDEAGEHLERALDLARQSQSPQEEAGAHEALAELHEARGDFRAANEHLRAQRRTEREMQDAEQQRQTRNLSMQFEVERARHDAETYRLRTEVEQHARRSAELLVKERTTELARAQQEVVSRLAMAAEYRDDTTGDHTRRVGRVAARIAIALGWSVPHAGTLGVAARLHDVGKIGIPDNILLKPGRLTAGELDQMRRHTHIGARILSGGQSELLRFAELIARTHHEHWDGSGYPAGLRGEEIPLEGRIVAIADVFDALTHPRPYKPAWTTEQAIAEIERDAGTHFDPHLVAVARDILLDSAAMEKAGVADAGELGLRDFQPDALPFAPEDTSQVLTVFEQLLVERTRELEVARRAAEEASESMKQIALTDSLTGLANRRAFENALEAACADAPGSGLPGKAGREQAPLTVISLDLDGLKRINDTRGHEQGDLLLTSFSRLLEGRFGGIGHAYRIGGDEFAVIAQGSVPGTDFASLLRVLAAQVSRQFPGAGVSSGVASFPSEARTPGDLLRLSDQRMYENKLQRRQERN